MKGTNLAENVADELDRCDQVKLPDLDTEIQELTNLKADLRDLTDLNKEFFEEESGIGIAKCLGPVMLMGIISWALIFRLIDRVF